jgi:hypothetical protein
MSVARSAGLALVAALGGMTLAAAEPPPGGKAAEKKAAAEPRPRSAEADRQPRAESLRLPPDAVVVICERVADALRLLPDAVVLPGHKYQEMLDEIARLRERLQPRRAVPPSRCQLKGKVEGRLAALQAQLDFVTDRPDTVVSLACGQAVPGSATLDGHVPLLRGGADGLSVQVDRPGEHQLTLDLLVPLGDRSPAAVPAAEGSGARSPGRGGQGLELALPRAAVTTLELDLPPGARDVRVGGRPWGETLVVLKNNRLAGGLGPTDKLDVTWRVPSSAAAPLLTAEGRLRIRLDPGGLTASAELTLRAEAGQTDVWRILAPRDAVVRLASADESRLKEPVQAANVPGSPLAEYTLRLQEASADPLTVALSTRRPVPRPGSTVVVGPFAVPGAARQFGLLQVSNAVPDLHLDYRTPGDLFYKQLAIEDERRSEPSLVAAFRYTSLSAAGTAAGPGLSLETEAVLSQVKVSRVSHTLSLRADAGVLRWYATTTLAATPRWADVDQLKLAVPADADQLRVAIPADAQWDDLAVPADRVVTLKLPRPSSDAGPVPITVALEVRYQEGGGLKAEWGGKPLLSPPARATLVLPRALGVTGQGGKLTVKVPAQLEASLVGDPAAGLESSERPSPQEQVCTWGAGRPLPEAVAVQWRPYAPDIRARAVIDVDLTPGGGEVRRHELRCQLPQPLPLQLALHVPAAVHDLRVLSGGTLPREEPGRKAEDGARTVLLPRPAATVRPGEEGEHLLVLAYSFRLEPGAGHGKFTVPLVTLSQGAQTDTRVRLWCASGMLPQPAGPAWDRLPVEEVADRKALPALVLRSPRAEAPLALHWGEAPEGFGVLVDRAVVRVEVGEGGGQRLTVRYRLRHLAADHLDVELPLAVALAELTVVLGGKAVAFEAVDDAGRSSAGGRVARLQLGSNLVQPGALLELSYALPPGRSGRGSAGLWTTALVPPILREDRAAVPTCWQVLVPPSWVVLGPESGPGVERTWGRRGWLLAPRLSWPAETALGAGGESVEAGEPVVVCWRNGAEPLTLTHVSQLGWLLACSLVLLVLGLGLYGLGAAGRTRALALGLGLLAVAVGAGAVLRPAVLSAIAYGCEPGAGVLIAALLVQWLVHERYRRQVVFLPSFSRSRSGSSLLRSGAARPAAPGEPSTVDVPRPAGSSASK